MLDLGLAGGRSEVTLERVAIHVDDARVAENRGQQPMDMPVVQGGPGAYFSTLPIKAIVHDLRAAGLPAAVSNSAGTWRMDEVAEQDASAVREAITAIGRGECFVEQYLDSPRHVEAQVLPFHRAVMEHPDFVSEESFKVHTRWIETCFANSLAAGARAQPLMDASLFRTSVEMDGRLVTRGLPRELWRGTRSLSSQEPAPCVGPLVL